MLFDHSNVPNTSRDEGYHSEQKFLPLGALVPGDRLKYKHRKLQAMTSAVKKNKDGKRGKVTGLRRGRQYRFWRQEGSRQQNGVFKGPEVVAHLVRVQIRVRGLVWLEPREGGRERWEIRAEREQGAGRALWAMGSTLGFL